MSVDIVEPAQADADSQRRWQQILQQRREHGEKYARLNAALLGAEWRQKLRALTAQKLKRSLSVTEELFHDEVERQQRRQQAAISSLRGMVDVFEQAFASHAADLGTLRQLQHSRMTVAQHQFQQQLADMEAEFIEETSAHRQFHACQQAAVAAQSAALDVQKSETRKHDEIALAAQKEAIVNADIEDQAVLRMPFDERKAELQALHKRIHKDYDDSTATLAASFEQLSASASSHDAALQDNRAQAAALETELSRWRSKLAASGREWTERNSGLRTQIHTLQQHCAGLRSSMSRFQEDHAFDLRQLCVQSNADQQQLQHQLDNAQRVLKMAVHCSNMADQHGGKVAADEASQQRQQLQQMPLQPSYDGDLPDDTEAAKCLAAGHAASSPRELRSALLNAALQRLTMALAQEQEVQHRASRLRSDVAAKQRELAQRCRMQDSAVVGVQCLPYTKSPDLLLLS